MDLAAPKGGRARSLFDPGDPSPLAGDLQFPTGLAPVLSGAAALLAPSLGAEALALAECVMDKLCRSVVHGPIVSGRVRKFQALSSDSDDAFRWPRRASRSG